jgi:hypothetical protein
MPRAARRSDPAKTTSSARRQRPAEGVGEVALAGAVGPDDGVDAGDELDDGPLGERLEALQTERLEPCGATHGTGSATTDGGAACRSSPGDPAPGSAVRVLAGSVAIVSSAAAADANEAASHRDLHDKAPLVIGAGDLHEAILGSCAGPALGQLLEPALGALERARRGVGGQLRRREARQPAAHRLPASVEEDGRGDRLEPGRKQDGPATTAPLLLAFAEQQVVAEVDPAGEPRQPGAADDRRSARRQDTLVVLGDDEADNGVAEELEALVVAACLVRVLMEPGSVDEGAGQQRRVAEGEPESLGKLGRGSRQAGRLPRLVPGRGQLACSSM